MKNNFIRVSLLTTLSFMLIYSNCLKAQDQKDYDVKSIDGIVTALYASISGEKGEPRHWDMFIDLFAPDAKLIPTRKNEEGKITYLYWTPEQYKEQAGTWLVENGFHEIEIFRVTEQFGPIAHLFSTYESRRSINDAEPFARGINSIQLMNDGDRWWILSIYWSAESETQAIPEKYLPR